MHIATKIVIEVFRSTYPPLKTSDVEHTEFIRKADPLVIRDTFKIFWLLILKDITCFHNINMKMKHWKALW